MAKVAKGHPNLNAYLRDDKPCYLAVCKVTTPREFKNYPTGYSIPPTTKYVFVMVLKDKSVGHSHIVGINSGLKIIYDCIEANKLNLNKQNLNKCGGQNCEFQFFCVAVELRDNNVHAKNT